MNWEAIGTIAEVIGAAGVIITLMYLAYQIRLNNQHLAREAQSTRGQAARENMATFSENAEIWVKDRDGEKLTDAEDFRLEMQWMALMFSYQISFQQLPHKAIEAQARLFRRWFETMPSFRATWEQNRHTFQPEFVRFMQENVAHEG